MCGAGSVEREATEEIITEHKQRLESEPVEEVVASLENEQALMYQEQKMRKIQVNQVDNADTDDDDDEPPMQALTY